MVNATHLVANTNSVSYKNKLYINQFLTVISNYVYLFANTAICSCVSAT